MAAAKKFRRARLIVIVLAIALVAAIAGGAFYGVRATRASFPQTSGSLTLPGLDGKVNVIRDKHGIPQIYASSDADLFRAQGFVQAQDRFWEMDTRRHITSGRLSEMFGKSQVETDAFMRTMGWRRVAQKEWDHKLSPRTKKYLRAYSRGVNDYLHKHGDGKDLSVEYSILGLANDDYTPKKWTPVDSVAWLKAMAWDLRSNTEQEINRALLPERLSKSQIKDLYPDYPYKRNKPIVGSGSVDPSTGAFDPKRKSGTRRSAITGAQGAAGARKALTKARERMSKVPQLLGPNSRSIGSNSWVVSGEHTTTGKPLLANDPHLSPSVPSVWYQMGLHCTTVGEACGFDTSGFTFAGMPGVIIGHNGQVSWGFTNLGPDVSDLYLEKVTKNRYLYNGKKRPFRDEHQETIKVAGGKPRTITVRSTNNGPVISDRSAEQREVGKDAPAPKTAPDRRKGYAVSLKWTALTPGTSMDAVFELDRAQNFTQFRKAAKDFEVPAQNLIYADRDGNIGYQAPGSIPIRGKGDGSVPAPGWDPEYRWRGYIPFKALPWEKNPSKGYIVTANQAVIGKDYPYSITSDWGYGTRSHRITKMIRSKLKGGGLISPDDMSSMQTDTSNEMAKTLTPYLKKIKFRNPATRSYLEDAQRLLDGWDYQQDADSAAAAYYNGVWRNLLRLTFGRELPKEVRPKGQCLWVKPVNKSGPVDNLSGKSKKVRECGQRDAESAQPDGGARWAEVVRNLLRKPHSSWWKVPKTFEGHVIGHAKGRDEVLAEAMKEARYELTSKLGKDVDTWSWGRLHTLTLQNQTLGTSGPGVVKKLLNRGPYQVGGGESTVLATGWNAAVSYQVDLVPSMRMVVDLEDLDKSRWINLTGASGHAFNEHYTDQNEKWRKGELLPWRFSKQAVTKAGVDHLTLKPAKEKKSGDSAGN